MEEKSKISSMLKDATLITGGGWVACVVRTAGQWAFETQYRLRKTRQVLLVDYLKQPSVDTWLCGALGSRAMRSRTLPGEVDLGYPRLFVFPIEGSSSVLIVGAKALSTKEKKIWKLVAGTLSRGGAVSVEVSPVVSDHLVPAIQEGIPYNLPGALDQVLVDIARQVNCQGAWLAVRRGDSLDIQSHWRAPQSKGFSLSMEMNEVLADVNRTRTGVWFERGQAEWDSIPQTGIISTTVAWGCTPLVVGQRLIGIVALWRSQPFEKGEWQRFVDLVARAAPSVEVIITFTELSDHLRRLAMLNDFVLTVSSGQYLGQIARRVFALLARAFQTETVGLYLLSTDERMVREYRNYYGKVDTKVSRLDGHPFMFALRSGQVQRFGLDQADQVTFSSKESIEMILVPLRYRGRTTGLLSVEIAQGNSFSVYDTHLLTVIAGHLAGMVEYSRLREEAEARARNLGLIHEVVQEVIGLVDKREVVKISAELLAQYFGYEFAVITLNHDEHSGMICGVGGSRAVNEKTILNELVNSQEKGGIIRHVMQTGESILVNDVTKSPLYYPIKGWSAGSELCVAIKDGERVIGTVDIESSAMDAFGHNDVMALESLAGILSNVISNADQYQRLQQTIRQLRLTQDELQARIEAQLVTERKLIQAEKLAAVGEMAAGVAHELNNPLTTVTGFTELVLDELPTESASRPDLEMVLQEARRARDVVRRLLDFSRRTESERTRTDVNSLVSDVLALTNHLMRSSGVQLSVQFGKNLPWVSVDRNQIKQVCLNLLHNALQAMPTGGMIAVQTNSRQRDGRKWVTISVQDSGLGISPEVRERIFEPFFTTKSGQGGTGLGLSVTYGIVLDHGGTIEVESQESVGSLFTVWLPI